MVLAPLLTALFAPAAAGGHFRSASIIAYVDRCPAWSDQCVSSPSAADLVRIAIIFTITKPTQRNDFKVVVERKNCDRSVIVHRKRHPAGRGESGEEEGGSGEEGRKKGALEAPSSW